MANFTERVEYKLEVIPPHSIIQCRKATIVEKDGVEVGHSYHRHVVTPGDDLTNECEEVKKVAAALWTPAVIAAYEEAFPTLPDAE
jgi:hypothetical protein